MLQFRYFHFLAQLVPNSCLISQYITLPSLTTVCAFYYRRGRAGDFITLRHQALKLFSLAIEFNSFVSCRVNNNITYTRNIDTIQRRIGCASMLNGKCPRPVDGEVSYSLGLQSVHRIRCVRDGVTKGCAWSTRAGPKSIPSRATIEHCANIVELTGVCYQCCCSACCCCLRAVIRF